MRSLLGVQLLACSFHRRCGESEIQGSFAEKEGCLAEIECSLAEI